MTTWTVGRALNLKHGLGDKVHLVRTEAGRTCCSFNSMVPRSERRAGTLADVTCIVCKRIANAKIREGDLLVFTGDV